MITHNETETYAWAQSFAKTLKPGAVIALSGNLGAGKTVLSRGICNGLGYKGTISSPTYTLVHEYPHEPPIFHLDLYRLDDNADLEEIGIDHYMFSQAITLIEWPERLKENEAGITHFVKIQIISEEKREITVQELL